MSRLERYILALVAMSSLKFYSSVGVAILVLWFAMFLAIYNFLEWLET